MPTVTQYYSFRGSSGEKLYWDHDRVNWQTIENQLYGLTTFTGGGIINGWEVVTVTQTEIDALSSDDIDGLSHTEACMMVKVTSGDGIIGNHAAYTPADTYISFPLINESTIYYVYAAETDCLAKDHRAQVVWNAVSDWDSDYNAIFLSRVITYYDELYDEVYVFQIPDDTKTRRRVLKDLEGPAIEAARDVFFRHVHSGTPDTDYQTSVSSAPSKIQLGSQDIEDLNVVPSSTIFLFDAFLLPGDAEGDNATYYGTEMVEYESAKVKVNGDVLSTSSYHLDNLGGKLYLKNSVDDGDVVQIIKYLDPTNTQIARGPQDDPASDITGTQPPVVTGEEALAVNPNYKLPAVRVGDVDASKIVFGTLGINRIPPIDHYGMNRIREQASLSPATLTRTRDQQRYFLVPSGTPMGYDTRVLTSSKSGVIGDVVSTPFGFYQINDGDIHDLTKLGYNEDEGVVLRVRDNTVLGDNGGEDRFNEVYILTDEGAIWISQDEGSTWEELQIPTTTGLVVNCFTVSTDKVERIVKNRKTWDYYKVIHIGTNIGLFSSRFLAAKGNMMGGSDLVNVETIAWTYDLDQEEVEITALQEIITIHTYVTEDASNTWYDRTLYISTDADVRAATTSGAASYAKVIPGSSGTSMIDMMWAPRNNGILMLTSNAVYISHSAEQIHIEEANYTEDYWKHPLTDIDEELHLSYDFSTVSKTASRLSREPGRGRYMVGLNDTVAISSTDQEQTGLGNHQAYIDASIDVWALSSVATLPVSITVDGSGYSINEIRAGVNVISLENAADQAARGDTDKEIADGWSPLDWSIPTTLLENARTVSVTQTTDAIFDPVFGGENQPTDYFVATDVGVWKSTDSGENWFRPTMIWSEETIPYVTRNGVEVPAAELTYETDLQSIRFSTQQRVDAVIKVEIEFVDYYAANGGWEQSSADLIVYVNELVSTIPYSVDSSVGKFTFREPLGKEAIVTFSVVDTATYISDVGETPHSEVIQAFVIDEDTETKLTSDLDGGALTLKVLSTDGFPAGVIYVNVDGETIKAEKKDGYTFRALDARSDTTHVAGLSVYLVNIERLYGIDDKIVRAMGGYSYYWSSITHANLLRLQLACRHIWSDMFHGAPGGDVAHQETLHIYGTDDLDTTNSSSTLWNGLDDSMASVPKPPTIVSAMIDSGQTGWMVGTSSGIWEWDGSTWNQLSDLDESGFVHYIENDRRDYLVAGADNGLWISTDDGETWDEDATFDQQQFAYSTGSLGWWTPARTYECFGKENGMSIIVYGWDGTSSPESFRSDHFDAVDDKRVYGFFQGIFYRIDADTMQKKEFDSIWIMSEEGLWVCYSGIRTYANGSVNPYSSILKGREPIDPGTRTVGGEETTMDDGTDEPYDYSVDQRYIVSSYDSLGDPVYQKLRFYGAFQDTRPKSVPLIFLTNDGLRVARNWRWVDPIEVGDVSPYLSWEATPLSTSDPEDRIVCNCYAVGNDDSITTGSDDDWQKYKCFIGTSKGVYRSYNGCHTVEPCQTISGATSIYALEYTNGTLYAATNNGIWHSTNDGDDWTVPINNVSNAEFLASQSLAQSFVAGGDAITRVSLLLTGT